MTTTAEKLTTINGALGDIKTAIEGKGVTPTGDITTYATAIAQISGGGEYPLTRISDDNANEIGTAFMKFTDANGNKFEVVLLDQLYWSENLLWSSNTGGVTDMPEYSTTSNTFWGNAKETATQNTQLILDWCLANNYTSAACEHCRSQSFVIGGTTYYGQLPNMPEVFEILKRFSDSIGIQQLQLWSSTQNSGTNVWTSTNSLGWSGNYGDGAVFPRGKTQTAFKFYSAPVLEIPLS